MRIISIDFDANEQNLNLEEIKMNRLGQIVLLAGPNGAGKSRLLRMVQKRVQDLSEQDAQGNTGSKNIAQILDYENRIEQLNKAISSHQGEPTPKETERQIHNIQREIRRLQDIQKKFEKTKSADGEFQPSHYFVPKNIHQLTVPSGQTKQAVDQAIVAICSDNNIENTTSAFLYIQKVQNLWYETSHPNSSESEEEKRKCLDSYEGLKDLLRKILQTDIGRDKNGDFTLFNLVDPQLSEGQKVLLQFAVKLHARGGSLKDALLLMDEPENHLHPKALLEVVRRLKDLVTEGQLWIATHSPYLLAEAPVESLWYMEKGNVTYAGSRPEQVLNGLLGDENDRQKIADFLHFPAAFAATQFALQCLAPPEVADHVSGDKQERQFQDVLENLRKSKGKGSLRVLDYGAGKGRLLAGLVEKWGTEETSKRYDYMAFDIDPKEELKSILAQVFKDRKIYTPTVPFDFDDQSVDVAVFCNVIHEIEPNQWLSCFGKPSPLASKMNAEGFLVIIEDLQMPVGEKAHQHGFIVLDKTSIQVLFGAKEGQVKEFEGDPKNPGRLMAFLVPASLVTNVTHETRTRALEKLKENYSNKAKELKNRTDFTFKDGRLLSLYTQMFANICFALQELGG